MITSFVAVLARPSHLIAFLPCFLTRAQTAAMNYLNKVTDKLVQMAADGVWRLAFGGTGGQGFATADAANQAAAAFPIPGVTNFAGGGYTGSGGKYDIAGVVHRDEYVMPKEVVQRVGVPALRTMHAMYGYAPGGLAGRA